MPGRASRPAWAAACAGLAAAVLAVELVARWHFGLGRQLLYRRDSQIEYLLVPDQDVMRFGRRVLVNRFSQRGADLAPARADSRERRVLLLGDSIVFGGPSVDEASTVAAILERQLREAWGRPVRVVCAATESWGPANVAAYLHRFGTFDADAAVWVLPTDDWLDAPGDGSKVGRDPDLPVAHPWLATTEILSRLVWRPLGTLLTAPPPSETSDGGLRVPQDAAMRDAVGLLRAAGVPVTLVHWPTQAALDGHVDRRVMAAFFADARASGAGVDDLEPLVSRRAREGAVIYRDSVHPTDASIEWLAHELRRVLGASPPLFSP